MRIVIDFDYTLFDTHALKLALIAALQPYGVTAERYFNTEIEAKVDGVYRLEWHIEQLVAAAQRNAAQAAVEMVLQRAEEFLYPDAIQFLQRHQAAQVTVLTFGSPAWQERKIRDSGVDEWVDEVITTDRPKHEVIAAWEQKDPIFINDRGSEIDEMYGILPEASYIWVRRPNAPYRSEPCTHYQLEEVDLAFDLTHLIR
jgi:phosphoglycolate phosphatase-like HAD superfamily hydrolase